MMAGVSVWAAVDLWGPRTTNLRQFDPDDVAQRETEMWRSYYDRQRIRMSAEMADLLLHQYNLPLLRSYRDKVARLELEWWIIHRQRASHTSGDLEAALALLAAGI